MTKKTIMNTVIILIVIIAIVMAVIAVNKNKKVEQKLSESDTMLNTSVTSDTTVSINKNLDTINVDNTNIDKGLKSIDDQLNTL